MTLDEMLALLPDNTAGEISAADMRTVVSELHRLASAVGQVFTYQWTTALSPAGGRVNVDAWTTAAAKVLVSETTDDGQTLMFSGVDNASAAYLSLSTQGGSRMRADVTGPTVDMGSYREVPVHVTELTGAVPAANTKVSVAVVVVS